MMTPLIARLFISSIYIIMALMTLRMAKYAPPTPFKHGDKVCIAIFIGLAIFSMFFL